MPERQQGPAAVPGEKEIADMVSALDGHLDPNDSDSLMKPEVLAAVYPVLFNYADRGFTPEAMMHAIKLAGSEIRQQGGPSADLLGA